jgi:hypothetical protein
MWTCEYEYLGTDEEGTEYYTCKVHGHDAIGEDFPCAGWYSPPYGNEEMTPEQALCQDQNLAYEIRRFHQ